MAKNRKAPTPENPETPSTVPAGPPVECVARTSLAEEIDGSMHRFAPGQRFSLPASRAAALSALIEIIHPTTPAPAAS